MSRFAVFVFLGLLMNLSVGALQYAEPADCLTNRQVIICETHDASEIKTYDPFEVKLFGLFSEYKNYSVYPREPQYKEAYDAMHSRMKYEWGFIFKTIDIVNLPSVREEISILANNTAQQRLYNQLNR